jgi:hypothetical protein
LTRDCLEIKGRRSGGGGAVRPWPPQCPEGELSKTEQTRRLQSDKPAGVKHVLAVGSFFGIWFGLWLAGWLAGLHFLDMSEMAVFSGALIGCVAGAIVAAMIVGDDPRLTEAGFQLHRSNPRKAIT